MEVNWGWFRLFGIKHIAYLLGGVSGPKPHTWPHSRHWKSNISGHGKATNRIGRNSPNNKIRDVLWFRVYHIMFFWSL